MDPLNRGRAGWAGSGCEVDCEDWVSDGLDLCRLFFQSDGFQSDFGVIDQRMTEKNKKRGVRTLRSLLFGDQGSVFGEC